MKNFYILFLLIILSASLKAACSGCGASSAVSMHPSTAITPTAANTWMLVDGGSAYRAGEYAAFSVQSGVQYRWSNCGPCTGLAANQYGQMDAVLTLYSSNLGVIACSNTSGNSSSPNTGYLTWTATFTGTVYVIVTNEWYYTASNCDHNYVSSDYLKLAWYASQVTPSCSNWYTSPSNDNVPKEGDNGTFQVYATGTCSYNLSNPCSWVTATATSSGVNYTVQPNCGGSRNCTINIINAATNTTVASFTISQSGSSSGSQPNIAANPSTICTGQTSTLTVNNPCSGCNYTWSNGSSGSNTTVSAPGSYSVTVTDDCGNSAIGNVTVQQNSQSFSPQLSASPNSICATGQTSSISITNAGSCSSCTYQWSGGTSSGSSTTVNTPGNYTVTVTNSCNQTSTASVVVSNSNFALQTPQLSASPANVCGSQTSTLSIVNASAFASCSGCTYNWSGGTGGNTQHTIMGPGTYSVTVTNTCNQSVQASVTVFNSATNPITPTFQVNPTTFCTGTATIQITNSASCNQCTYNWSSGANPSSGSSTTITSPGTYFVTVTNSCNLSTTGSVSVSGNPSATITPTNPGFCAGGNTTITATSGTAYSWSDGSTNQSRTVSSPGTYTVTITNPGGCNGTASATVSVSSYSSPLVNAGNDQAVQAGSQVNLGGSPTASGGTSPYVYSWSAGINNPTVANPTATVNAGTNFCVTVTDAHSCSASDCVQIDTSNCAGNIALDHGSKAFSSQGGADTIIVSAQNNCGWSASASNFITIISGQNGQGSNPPLRYSVGPCPSSVNRSGAITIGNQTFSVSQQCECNIPSSITVQVQGMNLAAQNISGATYQWQLNGATIPGATSRFYTTSADGIYTVEVCLGSGCCLYQDVTVTGVGIAQLDELTSLNVFPNPSTGLIIIEAKDMGTGNIHITVTNSIGQEVYSSIETGSNGTLTAKVDLSSFATGLYDVKVLAQRGVGTKKVFLVK